MKRIQMGNLLKVVLEVEYNDDIVALSPVSCEAIKIEIGDNSFEIRPDWEGDELHLEVWDGKVSVILTGNKTSMGFPVMIRNP